MNNTRTKTITILGIETSCDETAMAIVEARGGLRSPRFHVVKNLVASQIKVHRPFGGVVPNLAKREHIKNLPILFRKIFAQLKSNRTNKTNKSNIRKSDFRKVVEVGLPKIDLIAVTVGPGLEPALWTGINFAKELFKKCQMSGVGCQAKLVGVNHLEGHLYSFLLPSKTLNSIFYILNSRKIFPAIHLLVSGGHTILLLMESLTKWKNLGETRDDAAGEAFDKVARMLGLPYPGGPEIEKLASEWARKAKRNLRKSDFLREVGLPGGTIHFPRPMINDKSYDFSFSGLKTAVLYHLRDLGYSHSGIATRGKTLNPIPQTLVANVAASFQQAAVDVLVHKTIRAAKEYGAKSVMLSGGVAANKALRKALSVRCPARGEARQRRQVSRRRQGFVGQAGINFIVPDFKYNLDNAAMIAAAGYMAHLRGKKYPLRARGDLSV